VTFKNDKKSITQLNKLRNMYNSITVANYFIKKYGENGNLTPLKIIKLTYISYGWYLALTGNKECLISEKPEAWNFGPVFPTLYQVFKKFGKSPIKNPEKFWSDDAITDRDALFLDRIWEIYGSKTGVYLSAMTHTPDTPWSTVYPKGFNLQIPDVLIFEHYKSKMKNKPKQSELETCD
jgi:uncharacterized phage-associated protein